MTAAGNADDIQREIEAARVSLADAVDRIAYRTSPAKISADLKVGLAARAQTPAGRATITAVGLFLAVLVVKRLRK